ncbi:YafY family protein [Homoserinibacter sp. GY 40078]|uniref:helix-turn-helix transcriptional regulator n=1 Tax=Homoserinibacter sp. GY 40078 TaxID=2603275 RepID=UPI0011C96070|nr:WYL domain-containing protein [Homoserinibacter sp. GY 40078]TXK17763.1 WYL domain-containing protein [Homoserinibacter sp. GY 40078]
MTGSSARMLELLSLLQSRRDWPGAVLANRLGVTSRTVRRDVDRLRELGYCIDATRGPDGGYRMSAGSELPPLLFDDEQAVAIAVALGQAPASGVDLDDAAARALATVRQVMPSPLRHRVDGIAFAQKAASDTVDPAVLETVSRAAREERTIRFDYGDDADPPPRHVEPHAVVAKGGRWYLIAWDLERSDWRIFRLDRLRPRSGGVPFARRRLPAPDAVTFLDARMKGSESEDRWPCVGEIVLPLPSREVAPWIGDGSLEDLENGNTRVTIGAWSWTGVLSIAARFDVPFTIIGPEPLRRAAATVGARLLAAGDSRR